MTNSKRLILTITFLLSWSLHAEVQVDRIPRSLSLPEVYPESWVFIHDINYFTQVLGKYVILDVGATSSQHKGQFQGALLSGFVESKKRSELYVAETFYARVGWGKRTDVITIYEKSNLKPIAEIILPGEKRALMIPQKGLMQLTHDEKFALVFNFTPGASVTVVDMDQRKVVNEVPVPGCSLIYPIGKRGFSSLCSNGTLVSFSLDEKGQIIKEQVTHAFNDIDNDALYMEPETINGITYFASATGRIQPVSTVSESPKILPVWSLITPEEKSNAWLTTTGQSLASDDEGKLYIRMHQVEADGSHKVNSSEIWVFDVNTQKRLLRIPLQNDGSSITLTRGNKPWLVLVTANGIDVYNPRTGDFEQNIGGWNNAGHSRLHRSK